jgi:hypothetical protein
MRRGFRRTMLCRMNVGEQPSVVVRFIGGPADGLVFEVLEGSLPEFIGMGYPVSPYVSQGPIGSVRVFRYVAVN